MPSRISDIKDLIIMISAALAAIFSIKTNIELRRERRRLDDRIKIVLTSNADNRRYELPAGLSRGEFSRAEIMGRLGMISINDKKKLNIKQPRFAIDYVNQEEFLNQIDKIKNGDGNAILEIPCSTEEFDQFYIPSPSKSE